MSAAERGIDRVRAAAAEYDGDLIDLLVGTPCFEPPAELLESLRRAAGGLHHDYAPNQGTQGLRDAIVEVHRREGESIDANAVFVTHGAKPAVLAVLGTLIEPGDEVVLPTPCYPPYLTIPRLFGGVVKRVERRGPRFRIDVDAIASAISNRTRVIVVASPCNPTGATLSADDATRLVAICRDRGVRLLIDEAYAAFRFAADTVASTHAADPRCEVSIRVRSMSKTYGLCGWRTGYVVAEPEFVQQLTWFQASNINPPNSVMQAALEALPAVPADFHDRARDSVRVRLEAIAGALVSTPVRVEMPAGGFYAMIDLGETMRLGNHASSLDACRALARQQGVCMWPGEDYAAPGWARISAASLADTAAADELAARIRAFCGDA